MLACADAADALELGQQVDAGEVVEELLVGVLVRAVQVDVHQHARHDVVDDDALALHQRRQPVQHLVDAVLHVHDGLVRVGAQLEDDLDGRLAGAGGVGGHVAHARHAVDGLLQRDQHRLDQHLGAGAGVGGATITMRRRDLRELRDGQRLDRQHAQEAG